MDPEYLKLFVTAEESVVVAHIVSGTRVNKPVPRTAVTPMAVGRERMRPRRLLVRCSPFCRGITPSGSETCRPPVSILLELYRTRHLFYMVFGHAVASQVQYCTSTQVQGEKTGGQRHDDPRRCSRFYGHYGLWRRIRSSLCEAGLLAAGKALVAAKGRGSSRSAPTECCGESFPERPRRDSRCPLGGGAATSCGRAGWTRP